MADNTGIEWADSTQNWWIGCTNVGPGCDHCYAEARNNKFENGENWGPGAPRRRTSIQVWNNPMRWDRDSAEFEALNGRRRRVFCGSLMDIFDNAVPLDMAREAYAEMEKRTRLNWQPLTKRVGNVEKRIPEHWARAWPSHIGLMITVVNQEEADRDIRKLLDLKKRFNIPWVGLSMEPLLGEVNLGRLRHPVHVGHTYDALTGYVFDPDGRITGREFEPVDWVIVGGETGEEARPMHPQWAESLIFQCRDAEVPVLFKQWGDWRPGSTRPGDAPGTAETVILTDGSRCGLDQESAFKLDRELDGIFSRLKPTIMTKSGKEATGRVIGGETVTEYPPALL